MFNTTSNTSYNKNIVSTHVNAVTGNITKTYTKSFFKRFNLKSSVADSLFTPCPTLHCKRDRKDTWDKTQEVVIIQMVICGDMEAMVEIMFKDDYEEAMGC